VQVRDLSNGECGQKDEAQDGDGRQKAGPDSISGAAFAAEYCGESRHGACQSRSLLDPCSIPALRSSTSILQKAYRSLDALGADGLHRSYNSETSRPKKRRRSASV
jgi:hypothetical protein